MNSFPKTLAQIALIGFLIIGCFQVLSPFLGAILFAFVLWIASWPFYRRQILSRIRKQKTLAALIATSILLGILIVPTLLLTLTFAQSIDQVILMIRPHIENGLPQELPQWITNIPFAGEEINQFWKNITSDRGELTSLLRQGIAPARQLALKIGSLLGNGLVQLALVFFVLFFLYRDGESLSHQLEIAAQKLGGDLGLNMLSRGYDTINAVMLGIVGTAAAQGIIAFIGFLIAGVPAASALGFATFLLSMVPLGPPIIWGGAAVWLYFNVSTAWCIFMVLYGTLIISSVDNFLKPFLMARGSGLSLIIVALGMFGGILVFGFIGIFLGPVFLALAQMLFHYWINKND